MFASPEAVLPHRPPFLFVDSIEALEIGVSATGRWHLHGDEWFFGGHFPGRPTLPGVLMCEAIAQVGAYALLSDSARAGKLPLFGGLDSARFRRQVVPGDELVLTAQLVGFMLVGVYRGTWDHFKRKDRVTFLKGVALGTAIAQLAVLALYGYYSYSISILLIYASILGGLMVVVRTITNKIEDAFE